MGSGARRGSQMSRGFGLFDGVMYNTGAMYDEIWFLTAHIRPRTGLVYYYQALLGREVERFTYDACCNYLLGRSTLAVYELRLRALDNVYIDF